MGYGRSLKGVAEAFWGRPKPLRCGKSLVFDRVLAVQTALVVVTVTQGSEGLWGMAEAFGVWPKPLGCGKSLVFDRVHVVQTALVLLPNL